MRAHTTRVRGLNLLVYEALSYLQDGIGVRPRAVLVVSLREFDELVLITCLDFVELFLQRSFCVSIRTFALVKPAKQGT